jgi:hypothetical protein
MLSKPTADEIIGRSFSVFTNTQGLMDFNTEAKFIRRMHKLQCDLITIRWWMDMDNETRKRANLVMSGQYRGLKP